jgi:hypothetical protein
MRVPRKPKPAPISKDKRTEEVAVKTIPMLAFNPGNQDPEVLERLFVRRERLLAELERDVAEFARGGSRRHRLLIGPRGIGKSHLIAMLRYRVRLTKRLKHVRVCLLPQDLYGVTRFAELVDVILDRAPTPSATNESAEREFRDIAAASPLLILVENLDAVLRSIGPDGVHRLRSSIEDSPILLVATAPSLFNDVKKAKAPLYGFFDTVHLDELSVDDALELLQRVAELRHDEELVAFLKTPLARARAMAVEALAGGHPRIWILFTGCLSVSALTELVPLFMDALDDLTPYYQSNVGSLPPQLQQIVMALCRERGALSNHMVSQRTGIDERRVATALKELQTRGFVRKATTTLPVTGDNRMTWWELREPLLRFSLEANASNGKSLQTIVEFLRAWFGLRLFVLDAPDPKLTAQYVEEARTADLITTQAWLDVIGLGIENHVWQSVFTFNQTLAVEARMAAVEARTAATVREAEAIAVGVRGSLDVRTVKNSSGATKEDAAAAIARDLLVAVEGIRRSFLMTLPSEERRVLESLCQQLQQALSQTGAVAGN